MIDSTTGRARPLVAGSTDDEKQLQAACRLLHQEVTVTYTDVRH